MNAKQQALDVIKRMPEKASFEDITYEIEFLAAVKLAEEDIQKNRTFPLDEVKKMIPRWTSKSSSHGVRRKTSGR